MDTANTSDHSIDAMSTDDRIIHATLAAIGRDGLGSVTMSQVADAAGVARQTLYNHYGDIDAIVATAIGRHNDESIALLESALQVAGSPVERIEQMVRHYVMVGSHSQHAFDFGGGLSTDVREALQAYTDTVELHVSAILEDGRDRGDFRSDLNPEIDTILVRSFLDGLFELAADTPEQASQIVTSGTRTILAALS